MILTSARSIASTRLFAVDFMQQFNPGVYTFAPASLTDHSLIEKAKQPRKPYILSTGMSTMDEIREVTGGGILCFLVNWLLSE